MDEPAVKRNDKRRSRLSDPYVITSVVLCAAWALRIILRPRGPMFYRVVLIALPVLLPAVAVFALKLEGPHRLALHGVRVLAPSVCCVLTMMAFEPVPFNHWPERLGQ